MVVRPDTTVPSRTRALPRWQRLEVLVIIPALIIMLLLSYGEPDPTKRRRNQYFWTGVCIILGVLFT
jgi:hypothetical protein